MSVASAIKVVEKAKAAALVEIKAAIAKEATRVKLTRVEILVSFDIFWRDRQEVKNKRIQDLLELYSDEVDSQGFLGVWEPARGWIGITEK